MGCHRSWPGACRARASSRPHSEGDESTASTPYSRHDFEFCPQYKLIILRDTDCILERSDPALGAAYHDVAAASDYGVLAIAEQDLIPSAF
jgi:hypothetical protein